MFKKYRDILKVLKNNQLVSYSTAKSIRFEARNELVEFCQETFQLPKYKIQSMMLHLPSLQKIDEQQITAALDCLKNLGVGKKDVLDAPSLLNFHPLTIKSRYAVLEECGITKLNGLMLSRYVPIVVKKSIKELQNGRLLLPNVDPWEQLLSYFKLYPEYRDKLKKPHDLLEKTLYDLRMDVLYQFLFLKFNITKFEFERILKIYGTKHKPLQSVCQSVHYIENVLKFPSERIASNLFLISADKENMEKLVAIGEIGNVDMKVCLYKHPKLLLYNHVQILKIKQFLKDEFISNEAQVRCMQVYCLSPNTVKERITTIKEHPELKELMNNSRILQVVFYLNKVMKRLSVLQQMNKKCNSLHKLVTSNDEFNRCTKLFGDQTRGADILNALSSQMDSNNSIKTIKDRISRHPFWLNVPLSEIMRSFEFLKIHFSHEDIIENCEIVLYPVEDIKANLHTIQHLRHHPNTGKNESAKPDQDYDKVFNTPIDITVLSKRQLLSLLIYVLERNYSFSGDAIWNRQLKDYKIYTS